MAKGITLSDSIHVDRLTSDFYFEFPDDFCNAGERHAGWEFVYVDRGKVSVGADEATYILRQGEMVCHKPFEFHKIRPHEKGTAVIIFCFDSNSRYMDYFNNKILPLNQRQKQYINDIVNRGCLVFEPKDPLAIARDGQMDRSPTAKELDEQYIKNSIELLIISLLNADATEKKSRISMYEQVLQRQTLTDQIVAYLNENHGHTVRLEEISRQFSYSLSSIKRIFKEETGVGIICYLTRLRMEKAKELLNTTALSIGEIAMRVGYENTYYFSNAFKKNYGECPSAFRKHKRNG